MKESIFRKESLEKINSPGQLNRYIRVADPGTWIILAAIAILLLGAVVWGVFGTLETTVEACIIAENGDAACYFPLQDAGRVQPGLQVRAGDMRGVITQITAGSVPVPQGAKTHLPAERCCEAQAEFEALPDGVYAAGVIVEAIAPISFVIQ